jgi:hypothetical protein
MLPDAVWVLVDGLSHELLARLGCGPSFPFLQRCCREGRVAALRPLAPNCQTPPSLFTIWSGTGPAEHGLTGYDVPTRCGDDPGAFVDGFRAWPRHIPMVWDRYAAVGAKIRTTAVPFMQIDKLGEALLSATDVFGPACLKPSVHGDGDTLCAPGLDIDLHFVWDGARFQLYRRDGVPAAPLALELGQTLACPLGPAAGPAGPGSSNRALALRAMAIDGAPRVVCLGYQEVKVHGCARAARCAAGLASSFVASNPGKLYQNGMLGRRLDEGGEGAAEAALVDLMYEVHRSFADDFLGALEAGDANLVVAYYPTIDLLSHQILRYALDPDHPARPGPLAPLFARVLGWVERMLATAASLIGPDTTFIAHSDHGMTPIHVQVAPNRFFLDQGLLFVDDTGRIDPARTLMFIHPADNGLLVCHREGLRAAGIDPHMVMTRLGRELAGRGWPGLALATGPNAALGPEWDCDQYVQAPPGARLRAGPGDPLVCHSRKGGDHTVCTDEPWLRGVLVDMSAHAPPFKPDAVLELADILPYVLEKDRKVA